MSSFIIRRVGEIKYNFKVVFFQFASGWSKAAGIGFGCGIGNKSLQKKHMLLKWTSAASVLPDCRRKLCIRVSTVTRGPSASGPWKKHVLLVLNFYFRIYKAAALCDTLSFLHVFERVSIFPRRYPHILTEHRIKMSRARKSEYIGDIPYRK